MRGEYRNGFVAAVAPHAECEAIARRSMRELGLLRADGTLIPWQEVTTKTALAPAVAVVALRHDEVKMLGSVKPRGPVPDAVSARLAHTYGLDASRQVRLHSKMTELVACARRIWTVATTLSPTARDASALSLLAQLEFTDEFGGCYEMHPPGGKRELCERALDCAAREADEEVRLSLAAKVTWDDTIIERAPSATMVFRVALLTPLES